MIYDFAIIGGGIVGLATARELALRHPAARLVVVEKESALAAHQSGHNSGVIHAGIYYRPGSAKARLCVEGNRSMVRFCDERGIPHKVCGKVIVATRPAELPMLAALAGRAHANGVAVKELDNSAVRRMEPNVVSLAGLHVASTGVVDFTNVCVELASDVRAGGGDIRLDTKVLGFGRVKGDRVVRTDRGDVRARQVVNCAGLHSDRIARLAGVEPGIQIIPFRGEYFELRPERRGLVNNLVYPVPNPLFPFLGVHFTRGVDDQVHAGPNAVPGLSREAYRRTDIQRRDALEVLSYSGFWRLAARHAGEGARELVRSWNKASFVRNLQRLVPDVQADDLLPGPTGVRAQAVRPDGTLVDDFLVLTAEGSVHVCNAPSPAATASLEIARVIADRVPTDHARAQP